MKQLERAAPEIPVRPQAEHGRITEVECIQGSPMKTFLPPFQSEGKFFFIFFKSLFSVLRRVLPRLTESGHGERSFA